MKKVFYCFWIILVGLPLFSVQALNVATYNVWTGLTGEGKVKIKELESSEAILHRKQLQLQALPQWLSNADIVFLQEVNPVNTQAQDIAKQLNKDVAYARVNCGVKVGNIGIPTNLNSGLAILANKELNLKKLKAYKLSGGGYSNNLSCAHLTETRKALFAEVEIPGENAFALVVNLHLHHGIGYTQWLDIKLFEALSSDPDYMEEYHEIIAEMRSSTQRRKNELAKVRKHIEDYRAKKDYKFIIVGGDFNIDFLEGDITPDGLVLQEFAESVGVSLPVPVNTYSWNPANNSNYEKVQGFPIYKNSSPAVQKIMRAHDNRGRLIDLVYISKDVFENNDAPGFSIFSDKLFEGIHLSDHFGVQVDYPWIQL